MKDKNDILVSICCITYNQAPYVRQCLDGFLMQKTNFRYEIIIHDDCSTDGTTDIVREYAEKYPDLIVPIFQTVNQYQNGNKRILASFVYPKAQGKYYAICEGDDYWTDSLKLQKQVDFLEGHPDYGLCYTKAKKYYKNKIIGEWGDADCSFIGLLNYKIIPTLTRVERRTLTEDYYHEVKPENKEWLMGDYPSLLYYSLKSKIFFINESTGVYRLLDNSASHSKDVRKLVAFYNSADEVRRYFINKYIVEESDRLYLLDIVKKNEANYKADLYINNYLVQDAIDHYINKKDYLSRKRKIACGLIMHLNVLAPVIIFFYKVFNKIVQKICLHK